MAPKEDKANVSPSQTDAQSGLTPTDTGSGSHKDSTTVQPEPTVHKDNEESTGEVKQPMGENPQPTEGNNQPTEENKQPAEENKQQAEETKLPAEDNKQPTEEMKELAEEIEELAEENKQPTEENKQQTEENNQQTEELKVSDENNPSPGDNERFKEENRPEVEIPPPSEQTSDNVEDWFELDENAETEEEEDRAGMLGCNECFCIRSLYCYLPVLLLDLYCGVILYTVLCVAICCS